jgi:hypothetical protein
MNARYWPCLGVKTGRESLATRFIVALDSGGSAMNIRYRVELSEAGPAFLRNTQAAPGGGAALRQTGLRSRDDPYAVAAIGQPRRRHRVAGSIS